jgi:hypothetical protein
VSGLTSEFDGAKIWGYSIRASSTQMMKNGKKN